MIYSNTLELKHGQFFFKKRPIIDYFNFKTVITLSYVPMAQVHQCQIQNTDGLVQDRRNSSALGNKTEASHFPTQWWHSSLKHVSFIITMNSSFLVTGHITCWARTMAGCDIWRCACFCLCFSSRSFSCSWITRANSSSCASMTFSLSLLTTAPRWKHREALSQQPQQR